MWAGDRVGIHLVSVSVYDPATTVCTRAFITYIRMTLKECHLHCVYQNYNGLIINNVSQKHNYIYKYNNLPTTCFGLIRPSSGWKYSVRGKLSV